MCNGQRTLPLTADTYGGIVQSGNHGTVPVPVDEGNDEARPDVECDRHTPQVPLWTNASDGTD